MAKIRLDHKGIGALLQGPEVTQAIHTLGEAVAANVGAPTTSKQALVRVEVEHRTASGAKLSPRPAVDIRLGSSMGAAMEAKHGYLARAATAAGLELKSRKAVG
ncbi:hypothetical protein [Arthrobacter sp. B2a2-09]|uniref:hypothetical protein n=1 Tax=Arthrobacter sp. B2a2-09 TaxID=2952822 RepID=UPI0022CDBAA6|nr:hypothetical protein [Arthrobacter sp. B2a2-09]MCZ9884643.1 hypothetical protein [Arthrobacter sp. B2a2-09]